MKAPKRDRPKLPAGYIKTEPKGMLAWPVVEKQLRAPPYFWLATINDDGGPPFDVKKFDSSATRFTF